MQLMIRLSIPDPRWNNTVTQGTWWDRCMNPRARFSGMDHAMETSGLQNSSHLQESVIWSAFLLIWEFAPTRGILQEKELFQGLLKVRNYYHFLPRQTRIVTRKQKHWVVWNRLPDQRTEQGHFWQCQPQHDLNLPCLMHLEVTQGKGVDREKEQKFYHSPKTQTREATDDKHWKTPWVALKAGTKSGWHRCFIATKNAFPVLLAHQQLQDTPKNNWV